jgi:hypothetical protein
VAIPIDGGRDAKAAAVSCYRSQLLALEADWQLGPKLTASPEHFGRLAPPPPGWEGLTGD